MGFPIHSGIRFGVTSANKAIDMRRQGFVGTAMLPMSELEYTGIAEKLSALDKRFIVRMKEAPVAA